MAAQLRNTAIVVLTDALAADELAAEAASDGASRVAYTTTYTVVVESARRLGR